MMKAQQETAKQENDKLMGASGKKLTREDTLKNIKNLEEIKLQKNAEM